MPYRIDLPCSISGDALDRLVDIGALDVEPTPGGGLAALMADSVTPERVARALGVASVTTSPAIGRDEGSVWVLRLRPLRVASLLIAPPDAEPASGTLRLVDAAAFGTGHHPTTALCLEALEELIQRNTPQTLLDVGTGSGILALAALMLGAPGASGLDTDAEALGVAAENARLNGLADRLQLIHGGPASVAGTWPLVLANVLAAPLIEMAPELVKRVGHHGQLVLSGIPSGVDTDVDRAYRRLGMRRVRALSRAGWVALVLQASW